MTDTPAPTPLPDAEVRTQKVWIMCIRVHGDGYDLTAWNTQNEAFGYLRDNYIPYQKRGKYEDVPGHALVSLLEAGQIDGTTYEVCCTYDEIQVVT